LLRVHELQVNAARISDRLGNSTTGNLVKYDALCLGFRNPKRLKQMPRDGFSFAVAIRREPDRTGFFCKFFELGDDLPRFRGYDITGHKIMCNINPHLRFRQIADSVGSLLLVDMAHFAGLVAAKVYPDPVAHAEFVTSTTHKTLRGPRGGFILCKQPFAKAIDSAVFPGTQGGPLMHVIAAKAVCFREARTAEFAAYQRQIVANARALAAALAERGYRIVSGGTDNHLLLVDLTPKGLTGKEAQEALEQARITVNKNAIPFDPLPPAKASGIRLGTPALTTRGMKETEMREVAQLIDEALAHRQEPAALESVARKVAALVERFPLYPELRA